VLDDSLEGARDHGILAGLAWRSVAELAVFYTDRGMSRGMREAAALYTREGIPCEYRNLSPGAIALLEARLTKVPPCLL
jgi:hypothetical protein